MPSASSQLPNAHRLFITGGSGFIGSALVLQLLDAPDTDVLNFDTLSYAANPMSLAQLADHPRYQLVEGDVRDPSAIASALEQFQPTAVIHLAAESHVDRSIDSPQVFLDTNILGTANLLQAIRQYLATQTPAAQVNFRFLHVSTDEVFGSLGPLDAPTQEDAPYRPRSPYAASKAAADHLVRAWHNTYGIPAIITYSSNNFGPRQHPEKFIPTIIHHALNHEPIPVYGSGEHRRDWLYVYDHAQALTRILKYGTPGQTYNISAHNEVSNNEMVETVCTLLADLAPLPPQAPLRHYRERITHVEDRPGHDFRYALDTSKLKKLCNWRPSGNFINQLRETIQWYLNNPQWIDYFTQGKARLERLGAPGKGR